MKHKSLLAIVFAALILPTSVVAGPAVPNFKFDENGNAFLGSTPVAHTIDTITVSNPGGNGTMTVNALTYHIGTALQNAGILGVGASPVAGDWHVSDSGLSAGPSDLLRWTSTGLLYVFSQTELTGAKLADVGVPFSNSGLFHVEVHYDDDGTDGWRHTPVLDAANGFANGEPGYVPGGVNYQFISEGTAIVPEPSTLVLATFGALGLFGYRSRRKISLKDAKTSVA